MSKNVGDYTLLSKLGTGSFAQVYKAQHISGEMFALKIISKEKIGSTKLQQNLDSEISIMRDYRHENIVQLYDHFKSARHIYLVLEYCPGGDLQKYIKKYERLSETVARKFLLQLANGLSFLHSKNIIHRDIKPQNLLLSESSDDAIIKYADFGFAKHLVEASMAQTPCGTPLYMAPEIFEMQEYDVKADIWSLGCVVYEMLVGTPPFKGQNPRELFLNIRSRKIRVPPEVIISPELQQLLLQLLEIDPRRRISLDELLNRAKEFVPSATIAPRSKGNEITSSTSSTTANPLSLSSMSLEKQGKSDTQQAQQQQQQQAQQQNITEFSKLSGSPTIGTKSSRETIVPEDQQNPRPSGIAIGLSNSSGGTMRRNRSKDQLNGGGYVSASPPSVGALLNQSTTPVSTSPSANQRPPAVTSATATMIMGLTNSGSGGGVGGGVGVATPSTIPSSQAGTSPSQGTMVPKHKRTNSGDRDRRYSAGDLSTSPVTKALSISKGDSNDRVLNNSDVYKMKESSNTQMVNYRSGGGGGGGGVAGSGGNGSTMIFGLAGPIDHRSPAGSRAQMKSNDGDGEDGEDFVMVEQIPSHPWKAIPNDSSQSTTSQVNPGHAKWYTNSIEQTNSTGSGIGIGIGMENVNVSGGNGNGSGTGSGIVQDETLHFNTAMRRCSYTVQMVAAITAVADQLVRDSLHPKFWKNEKRLQAGEQDSKFPDDDSLGSNSSGERSNRPRSFDIAQLPEQLSSPFALYLHAMTFLHDSIQRTLKFKESSTSDSIINQIDILLQGLTKRFEQILQRAENCRKHITANQILPIPEQLLYQHALQYGQEASVDEMLGNFSKASERYHAARLLLECVLMTASESSDRKVLQQFIKMFTDQLAFCEESKSIH